MVLLLLARADEQEEEDVARFYTMVGGGEGRVRQVQAEAEIKWELPER